MNDFLLIFKQELVLSFILLLLLILKVSRDLKNDTFLTLVNGLLLINLFSGFFFNAYGQLFNDMYRSTELIVLEKNLLNLGTLIISLQAHSWLKEHKHASEFYILLLSTLLGMFLMLSSGNLLIFYLGLELSTIPLAAIVNFDLDKRKSSEAAMKLILSSAFASGLLLFGISLIYGITGTLSFSGIAANINAEPLSIFACILLLAGFGFKISAAPFHLWTADVYEGAPVAVTAYLSVISKSAVVFVLLTVLYQVLASVENIWHPVISLLAAATILIGNLFAVRQENIKRFLAFSSIAQVGFILVALTGLQANAQGAILYFVLIYIFSNLAVFGVVSIVSAKTGRENIGDFKGFYKTNPLLSWILAIGLFSLAGIPPTAGFFGKFFLLVASAGKGNLPLIVLAALNLIISLYYYLRIIKAIFMEEQERPIPALGIPVYPKLALYLCLAGILITGFLSYFYNYIQTLGI